MFDFAQHDISDTIMLTTVMLTTDKKSANGSSRSIFGFQFKPYKSKTPGAIFKSGLNIRIPFIKCFLSSFPLVIT